MLGMMGKVKPGMTGKVKPGMTGRADAWNDEKGAVAWNGRHPELDSGSPLVDGFRVKPGMTRKVKPGMTRKG